ncbi:hypothetical protein [Lysinibacillus sp. NPDC086135]|uniref:hypothetical protein n=1 Tax=Lysinibacillus sp. NPDC086135 TaxID=3364130 RepID=UPI003823E6A1
MVKWVELQFVVKNPYWHITKDTVVKVEGEKFIVKRIDGIVLLDEAVGKPNSVKVFARGVRSEMASESGCTQ